MFTKFSAALFLLAISAKAALAVVPVYGQCGGTGYTGDTQCASGSACIKLNDWYFQCQPSASSTPVPTSTTTTTTIITTTATPTTTTTAPTPTSTVTGPVIVLPLGDSITFGMGSSDGNAYRKDLKDRLTATNVTTTYIGTVKNGNMQNNENEGHSGATITQISGYGTTPLAQKPEVVLLKAGTNDVAQNSDLANAPNRLIQLVDKIFTASPSATVLVASLIPLSISQANVDSYNSRLQTLIQAKITAGQHVVWVSMSAVTNSDLADGVHPNAGGYVKMGQAWFNGWNSAVQKGWIRKP